MRGRLGLAQNYIISSVGSKSSSSKGIEKTFSASKQSNVFMLHVYGVPSHPTIWPKMRATQLSKHFHWTPLLNTWPIRSNP